MATRATNSAVEQYRKVNKTQRVAQEAERVLHGKVQALSPDEFDDYMVMTQDIDRALSLFGDDTPEYVKRAAELKAGRDHG